MEKTAFYFSVASIGIAIFAVLFFLFGPAVNPLGSVESGSEYIPNYVTSADVGSSSVKAFAGTIGSIVVASSTNVGAISFYATSSTATSSTNLVFTFPANADEGTYTFDVGFGSGLIMDVGAGFNGSYVLTFR